MNNKDNKDSMNILIIGNGFDLAHNLPTKYEHFLKFIITYKDLNSESTISLTDDSLTKSYIDYLKKLKQTNQEIYDEIGKLIENNIWIEYFINIHKNRVRNAKDGWIDFENEISKVIIELDNMDKDIHNQAGYNLQGYGNYDEFKYYRLYSILKLYNT